MPGEQVCQPMPVPIFLAARMSAIFTAAGRAMVTCSRHRRTICRIFGATTAGMTAGGQDGGDVCLDCFPWRFCAPSSRSSIGVITQIRGVAR
mmetsp:Transcript_31681/g.90381  ORF Transcript_31681/g.90381 Transcript_31681/m.90381 type:complete len:92 (+) Transcript_31681:465-740(+)